MTTGMADSRTQGLCTPHNEPADRCGPVEMTELERCTGLFFERDFQTACDQSGISKVRTGKWIAPVEGKVAVGHILNIELTAHIEVFIVDQIHSSRPAEDVPGLDTSGVEVHQV